MQADENIWTLISRTLALEPTENEELELDRIFFEDSDIAYYMQIISSGWDSTEQITPEQTEEAFNKLRQRIADQETDSRPSTL